MDVSVREVRVATPADAAEIASIYQPHVTDSAISFELDPPPAEVVAQRMTVAGTDYPWLVAVGARGLLGYAYGAPAPEPGRLPFRGRGVRLPGQEHPGEEIGVFRRVGFKFDAWHDVSWWQKRLGDDSLRATSRPA